MRYCEGLLRVDALDARFDGAADALAVRFGLPRIGDAAYALQFTDQGLRLTMLGEGVPGPVIVDFVGGAVAHRR